MTEKEALAKITQLDLIARAKSKKLINKTKEKEKTSK